MKIFLLLLMSMYASSSGAQHPSWQNYTTQEGLPSNEIYYMMQDSRGLLWFSTGQGICRFNGYEFTRPIDTSAAATGSTFQIVEDAKGRIWYMNLNATLSIIENDTVRSWEHNHLLKSFVKKHKTTWRFAVGKDGTVWVPSWASGFLVVQRDGTHQTIPESNQNGIVFSEIGGQIINASKTNQDNAAELVLQHRMGQTPEIIRWQNGKAESLGRLPIDYSKGMAGKMWGIWRLRNGDFIAACLNTFYLIRENHLIWYGQKENSPETILQDIDGSILMTVSKGENKGLLRFRSLEHFQRNEFNNLQINSRWHIETLTTKHGLPSNQVNDVAFLKDEIWVATDKGIARFNGKPVAAPMPPPMLEKFAVNNRDTVFADHIDLAYYQRNISLRFFALHFRSNGDIPYRYRLLPADTAFVYTHNRVANFSLLSPGEYIFEVQAQNEDGQWSEPARWPFRIRPPWWASWWFRSLVAAALCATAYLFFQNRLRAVRREAAEREKIRDLEAAALRAQMNPHFIFNCLQAIQSFIAQNDRDAAATYLARFARLVRLALHGSVDGLHTLAEEMVMLENYLHLEQLRFHDKFEFAVRATPGIDSHAISLPPLLVQPLVENALIHGMQDRERGGRVEVVFVQKGSMLEVSVTDNGPGFSEKDGAKKGPHRSVGMMLTQKRLDLLAGTSKTRTEYFARETIFDENGIVMGALVRILIPVAVE